MVRNGPISLPRHSCLILLLVTVSLLLACGPASAFRGNLWPVPTATPEPPPTPARWQLAPTSVSEGLDSLQSYRTHLTVEFEGVRNGQPAAGQIESLTEVIQHPRAVHRQIKSSVITPTTRIPAGVSEFFQAGGKSYVKKASQDSWLVFANTGDALVTQPPDTVGFLELERLITLPPAVSGPPRPETLEGLSVQHYTFDQNDLDAPNITFEQARGDLWIASPGNYLMQYVITASVKIVIPDPKAHIIDRGTLTLRYALTGINDEFDILPPQDQTVTANNSLARLPRLPDARLVSVFPTFIEYTSATSSISATLFYRDELSAQNWTEDSAAIFAEKSHLAFSKAGQALTVIIDPTDDPAKIKVVLDAKN